MKDMEIKGIEEFTKKINVIEKKAPDRIEEHLREQGNLLRRTTRANTNKKTGKLRSSYRLTRVDMLSTNYEIGMYNTAPHFHLIEKGHRKVSPSGAELGWTPGYFMVEKTVIELDKEIYKNNKSFLDTLFKELK